MDSEQRYKAYAIKTNSILKESFKLTINLSGFMDLIESINNVSDVDMDLVEDLIVETNAWSLYLEELNNLIIPKIDKFKVADEHYSFILEYLKTEKRIPEEAMLTKAKLTSRSVGDLILELSQKEEEISSKIKTLKTFSAMTDGYVRFLKSSYYNLSRMQRSYSSRFFNV